MSECEVAVAEEQLPGVAAPGGGPAGPPGAAGPHAQPTQEPVHPAHPLLLQVCTLTRRREICRCQTSGLPQAPRPL